MAKLSFTVVSGLLIAGTLCTPVPPARAQSAISAEEQQKRELFLRAREDNRKEARSGARFIPSFLKASKDTPPGSAPPEKKAVPPAGTTAQKAREPGEKKSPVGKFVGLFKPASEKSPGPEESSAPPSAGTVTPKEPTTPPPSTPSIAAAPPPPAKPSAPAPAPAPATEPQAKPPPPAPKTTIATTPAPSMKTTPTASPAKVTAAPAARSKPSPTLTPAPAPTTPAPKPKSLVSSPPAPAPAPLVATPAPAAPQPAATPAAVPAPPAPAPAAPREVVTAVKTSVAPPAATAPTPPDVTVQPPEPGIVPDFASVPPAQKTEAAPVTPDPDPVPAKTTAAKESSPPDADGAGVADLSKISIAADNEAEFDLDTGSLIFVGNAVMEAPHFKLEGDRITVSVTESGDGITGAHAVGSVKVSISPEGKAESVVGQSAKGDFDPGTGSFTLLGWPEVRAEGKRDIAANADTTIILYTDGRVKTIGDTKPGIGDFESSAR